MTILLLLSGLAVFALAVALLTHAALTSRARVSTSIRNIDAYGVGRPKESASGAETRRSLLAPLADRLGATVQIGTVPAQMLQAAGMYSVTPQRLQGFRVMLTVLVPSLLLFLSLSSGASLIGLALFLAAAVCCWFLPPAMLRSRGQRRMDEIDRDLPQLVDVLTSTVEAGLGFAGSLRLVGGRFSGPLGQELRLMLQEQSLGVSTEQALENFMGRCETPSVRAFVRAVNQGESLGVSIGAMLRNLAGETRKRRAQLAREKMMKAPVKMLFPLVMFMLPALFIVLMYPALTGILHALTTTH